MSLAKRISRLPFAPIVALAFACAAGVLVMATPLWLLERGVAAIGLGSVLPAAAPPLGATARLLLAVLAAGGTALVAFVALLPVSRALNARHPARPLRRVPRAVPAPGFTREPIFAGRELGAPFMSDDALKAAPVATIEEPHCDPTPPFEALPEDEVDGVDCDDVLLLDAAMISPEEPPEIAVPHSLTISPPAPEPEPELVAVAPEKIHRPVPIPPPDASEASIDQLIARLERGLHRQDRTLPESTMHDLRAVRAAMDGRR